MDSFLEDKWDAYVEHDPFPGEIVEENKQITELNSQLKLDPNNADLQNELARVQKSLAEHQQAEAKNEQDKQIQIAGRRVLMTPWHKEII
ncbi:hypothetical protein [Lactobacillus helveticus]|uniref:hypothetical protein n=1 Tax=Lactobacillus helveticus TaxID=1587 RepID=UPI001562CE7C|nr:hypothetical protein [Lactobacillus helveticus]NRO08828.1 hypothetical protein [Lactobacillus helveticus]NRO20919.1 hypothetical protein [Lactobacillus helveticus]NRO33147.1 hypothetical protein [Lactobacillus helveticus]NRO41113.1 hypothetical protein [Lactobacillus helveticus]NRO46989.1 hypothetical protein [Lactobacillus helveticus]